MNVDYKTLVEKKTFSSNNLSAFSFGSCKVLPLKKLLSRKITKKDNGVEVGSLNYIKKSPNIFIKAKGLSESNFLLTLESETFEYIRPQVFVNMNLKKGDLLISKDSNIGEVAFLESDMPNAMLSTALYRLPVSDNKYYIASFIKSSFFKNQLNILVPKGATIRHAGTRFLDCFIPFSDDTNITALLNILSKYVVLIESEMKTKEKSIFNMIDNHLKEHCTKKNQNHFDYVQMSDLMSENRFDVGMYSKNYRIVQELISNYDKGVSSFEEKGYSITRGQNLQVSSIGKSLYSNENLHDYYCLILSNSITNNMTFKIESFLGSKQSLKQIKKGDIIFTCRGNLGKSFVLCNNLKSITNIDNVHISSEKRTIDENIAVACFLHYLQKINHLNNIAIQGSGADSFTKYHFDKILIPNFDNMLINNLSVLYNSNFTFDISDNENELIKVINKLGLYQLEALKNIIVKNLNLSFENIINGNKLTKESILKNVNNNYVEFFAE